MRDRDDGAYRRIPHDGSVRPGGGVGHLFIPAGNALCIVTTGAAAPQGFVAYVQQ